MTPIVQPESCLDSTCVDGLGFGGVNLEHPSMDYFWDNADNFTPEGTLFARPRGQVRAGVVPFLASPSIASFPSIPPCPSTQTTFVALLRYFILRICVYRGHPSEILSPRQFYVRPLITYMESG